ncbi:hypothetical protein [Pontiella sp.]|uniref:hypothetical protein n=1 Tax=Pontiella sp. TaxID=2837462 RepID=UPI00356A06B3
MKVALRNDRLYHKLEEASLKPLRPALEAGEWNEVAYDLANVPRQKNREVRVYINYDKALTGKELSGAMQIRLKRRSGLVKALRLGQPRKRVLPRPYVAVRAHVKYALQNNWFFDPDYYADRILMLDRSLEEGADGADPYRVGGPANFARTVELMRMSGADGIGMLNIDVSTTYLNSYLAVCDGIHFAGQNHLVEPPHTNRFYAAFYRDIVIPLLNEVMKQPHERRAEFSLAGGRSGGTEHDP